MVFVTIASDLSAESFRVQILGDLEVEARWVNHVYSTQAHLGCLELEARLSFTGEVTVMDGGQGK